MKTIILSVDTEKRRVSFGLKPSYFADEDFQAQDESSEEEEPDFLGVVDENGPEDDDDDGDGGAQRQDEDQDDSDEEGEDMNVDVELNGDGPIFSHPKSAVAASASTHNALRLDNGFQWSAGLDDEDVEMESSSENDEDEGQISKKRKRKHKEIEQDLTADLQTKTPESNADFERNLLGSPNSSYLWIQYMSFQLQLSEVDKAREIAQRALKMINFREEQEKLNVWIALLNLENVYGTEESLDSSFKDAARHNDSKTIHLRLAAIFDQSEKADVSNRVKSPKSSSLISVACRKLKISTNEQARNSVRARKFGHSSLNIISVGKSSKRRVLYCHAACRALKKGNVRK